MRIGRSTLSRTRLARRGSALAAAFVLVGCTNTVPVDADFPRPLVQPLPLRVGIYLGEELRAFQHREEIPQHSRWDIKLGDANVKFFEPVLSAMFLETVALETMPPADTPERPLDGIIEPQLEKFEFDVPRDSNSEFVEVWVQYRMNLYLPDGTLIAEWPVSGYGKSETGTFSANSALARAAVEAMREAGATLAIRFPNEPKVTEWLEEVQDASTARLDDPLPEG